MNKIRGLITQSEIFFWKLLVKFMKNHKLFHKPFKMRNLLLVSGILVVAGLFVSSIHVLTVSNIAKKSDSPISGLNAESIHEDMTNDSGQTNYLIILVDSLVKDKPKLEGVWLAGHVASLPEVVFLPLYPSNNMAETCYMEGIFELSDHQTPEKNFLEFLRSKEINWEHFVLLDKTSIAELASIVTWSLPERHLFFSQQDIKEMLEDAGGPDVQIKTQARLASSFCQIAPDLARSADPGIIWNLLNNRMHSDITLQAVETAHQLLSRPGEKPICEFPTLRELTFSPANQ